MVLPTGTVGAEALDHVVDRTGDKAIGNTNGWDGGIVQAEGLVTALAEEVGMAVVVMAVVLAVAEFVLNLTVATVDGVDEVVLPKFGQRTVYARLVYGKYMALQLAHGHGVTHVGQRLGYNDTVGRGSDFM